MIEIVEQIHDEAYNALVKNLNLLNFTVFGQKKEFACVCGCGLNVMHPELLKKLQIARSMAVLIFHISSGCRCDAHNKNEQASDTSSHLPKIDTDGMCTAVDIRTLTSGERFMIVRALIKARFTRIGIGEDFVHVDIDWNKVQNVIWDYYPEEKKTKTV